MWKHEARPPLRGPIFFFFNFKSLQCPEPVLTLLRRAGPLSSSSAWCTTCILLKAISRFPHLCRWMGIFPFGNLHPTPGREARQEKGTPTTPSPGPPCRGAHRGPARRARVSARRDGPIRRSLALCSFRPLTRRRCGGPGCSRAVAGWGCGAGG